MYVIDNEIQTWLINNLYICICDVEDFVTST